ncbi:BapA/Bap/LapF family prefix-like domain-containing protein, partial [Acinetobacter nectaris]|uniref:BapA/Bap/LapF family prefix-like domain-containing protein n=1 Tax=Acinetobacter nectaris TaxID=1219382 RepID=UPI001F242BDD
MINAQVVSKTNHKVLENKNTDNINISENSVVKINVKHEDVENISRNGQAIIITLKNGEKITVNNFYSSSHSDNSLVFIDDNHSFLLVEHSAQGTINYEPISSIESLLYDSNASGILGGAGISMPLAIGGGALLAGGIIAASTHTNSHNNLDKPSISSSTIKVNDNGTLTINGVATAGSTVTVTYPDGSKGTATAGSNGSYSITSTAPQHSGNISVTATDASGNTSGVTNSAYQDTTAPTNPTVVTQSNANGTLTVTGKAEIGSTITVTYPDGSKGTVTVGNDGSYSITSTVPQHSGNISVTAT